MKIAVIIPCRNEQANIKECIDAIYASKFKEHTQIKVIVVDGKSNDKTIEIITGLQKIYNDLSIVENTKQLTPFAFNLGIEHDLNCDYFQIVGARQIISSNYLSQAVQTLQKDASIWCVGGKVENVYLNNTGKVIAAAMATTFGMGLGNFRTLDAPGFVDTVGTPMYPKIVFEKIGFFDENLIRNQDDDFNYRLTNAGGKIFFDSSISLKYYVRGNFKGLWKQFFQYGYWKVFVNKKHKSVTTLRQLVPPLFVAYTFALLLFCSVPIIPSELKLLAIIPFLFYLGLAVLFAGKTIQKEKNISFSKVLLTFPILHFSYGLGYLKGIWSFLLLNKKPSEKSKELSR